MKRILTIWAALGAIYVALEVVFRGQSHPAMLIVGGLCGLQHDLIPFGAMIYGRAGLGYGISGWTGQAQGANNLCNCNYDSNFGTYLVGAGVTFKVSEHFDLRLEDYAFLPFNNNTMIGSTNIVAFGTQYNF